MAEADEDVILRGDQTSTEDVDLSDETQDFRFLASISREDAAIPKRGEKDFEPHSTALQSNTLAASRQAMHNALSFQRVHPPKGQTIATYHPDSNMAYCENPKGTMFAKMGHVRSSRDDPFGNDDRRGNRLWLLPEEVLYLLERGTVDVRWPRALSDDTASYGLPMSLQAAYAMFLGDEEAHSGALTFERFSVYTGLKRMGFTVMRAPSWDGPGQPLDDTHYPPHPRQTWRAGLFATDSFWQRFLWPHSERYRDASAVGPLATPSLYRDYESIYRRLALVNFYDPTHEAAPPSSDPSSVSTDSNFRIIWHVWRPNNATFKKSAPGLPDFRIAVIDARSTAVPTLEQLAALMHTAPYDPPSTKAGTNMYAGLKHGYKNVVLAVVDQGVTSYIRVADAALGREKVYERRARAGPGGGKRGGRGGGRGRGRERGRGG